MFSLDEKRKIEAKITERFLNDNKDLVIQMIVRLGNAVQSLFLLENESFLNDAKFYLKGGNAFSILKGECPKGDYDFQLSPSLSFYESGNWNTCLNRIDDKLITILEEVCQCIKDSFVVNAFDLNCISVDKEIDSKIFKLKPLQLFYTILQT